MWLRWREGKPQVNPWVSPWRFGHQGAQFPGGSISQLGHSQCWGTAKGTRTYCTGQAGPSVIGAGFRAPKISYHMHGQNANAEWMHSWILLAIPSHAVTRPCVPRVGERAGAVSRCDVPAQPEPARAVPSPHERPRQSWREPRGARAAAAPWRPRPPCDHLPPGGACGPKMADGEDTEHTNPSARQLKPPQTPLG